MFSNKKEKPETYPQGSNAKLSLSEIKTILRTVRRDKAFYFYEGIGKPTEQVATSLIDFRDKVNTVPSASLVFHLRRKDFGNWIRDVIRDSALARRIGNINPNTFDLKMKLHATVNIRIKELKEMLPTPTVISEDFSIAHTTPL